MAAVEPEQGWIGPLSSSLVLAAGLPEVLGRLGLVEDVVDDLEHESDRLAVLVEGGRIAAAREGASPAGGANQGSGLQAMDVAKTIELVVHSRRESTHGVMDLALDHEAGTLEDGSGDLGGGGGAPKGDFGGEALEEVADEDGDRVAVDLVRGGTAASQVVVIHGGKVVMDEAEGVDAFEGDRGGHGIGPAPADRFASAEGEQRAKALAAAEQGVSRRLVEEGAESTVVDRGGEGRLDLGEEEFVRGEGVGWHSSHGRNGNGTDRRNRRHLAVRFSTILRRMSLLDAFLDFMARGGFVMWPLLLLSVLTVSTVLERAMFWWRIDGRAGQARYRELANALRQRDSMRAGILAERDPSPYAALVRRLPISGTRIDEASATMAAEEIRPAFERGQLFLATVMTASPMLGILGTVVGIIGSFELLGGDATITDPGQVSGGIAEALVSTASGLVVALTALFPYMILRGRQDRALGRLEALAGAIVAASTPQATSEATATSTTG